MIMYINNKQGDNDSTVSGIKVSERREEDVLSNAEIR